MTLIYVTGQVTLIHNILLSAVSKRVLIHYGLGILDPRICRAFSASEAKHDEGRTLETSAS